MAHLAICRSQGQSCREGYRQTARIRRAHDARTDQVQLTGGVRALSTNALTPAPRAPAYPSYRRARRVWALISLKKNRRLVMAWLRKSKYVSCTTRRGPRQTGERRRRASLRSSILASGENAMCFNAETRPSSDTGGQIAIVSMIGDRGRDLMRCPG